MDLTVTINADQILSQMAESVTQISQDIHDGVRALSVITHAHIVEEANKKLHSRQEAFVKALKYEQIDDHTWAITVPADQRWIEDGMKAGSMLPGLLNSPKAKTAKDGSRYIVIPMKKNDAGAQRGPSQSSAFAKQLANQVRAEMRKQGIPYQRPIERDASGKPKMGLLHAFDIMNSPKRPHWTSPALQGVRVYQNMTKGKRGEDVVSRDIMTFRVASSKHAGLKWEHPGLHPMHFLEEAQRWALEEWSQRMLPEILKKYGVRS